MSRERKHLDPPTHLDPEYLYHKYEPLRKAVYKKFKDVLINQADKEDLISTIDQLFLQLVSEYNPHRGVDFPYFIKRMLDLRVYHYITKYLNKINKEIPNETVGDSQIEDIHSQELIQRVIDLYSINPDLELGEKHAKLMIGILVERKTLKELADEEGVPVERVNARMYFLLRKMRKLHDLETEEFGDDIY